MAAKRKIFEDREEPQASLGIGSKVKKASRTLERERDSDENIDLDNLVSILQDHAYVLKEEMARDHNLILQLKRA
jgi:hypothetical protein